MPIYTVTSYNDNGGIVDSDWTYHQLNIPLDGDTFQLSTDMGSSGTPLTSVSMITINTGVIFNGNGYKIYLDNSNYGGTFVLGGGGL